MSERAMRMRIGLFVLMALVLMGTLVVLFSATPAIFKGGTPLKPGFQGGGQPPLAR